MILTPCRLRRAVLHPSLVLTNTEESQTRTTSDDEDMDVQTLIQKFSEGEENAGSGSAFVEGVLQNLSNEDEMGECPICLDVMDSPMIIPVCLHQWYVKTQRLAFLLS